MNGNKFWVAALAQILLTGMTVAGPIPSMMRGDTAATSNGWEVTPLFTVGQEFNGYAPPGVLDGLGAVAIGDQTVRILMNHELQSDQGNPYVLASGIKLGGARISFLDLDRSNLQVTAAGLAYDNIYDRKGEQVQNASQLTDGENGLNRLCSARSVPAGQYQFEDTLFFSGEESNNGSQWVLDVANRALWSFPAMGRGAWENVTPLASGHDGIVALVAGDDSPAAPLYLYLGRKNAAGDNSFLDRNGLKHGQLSCWRAITRDQTPESFHGFDRSLDGHFVALTVRVPDRADTPGYDSEGYLDARTLRDQARRMGCFTFSRPEDLHEDPANPDQIAFASTGRGQLFPTDNWGTLYTARLDLSNIEAPRATVTIIHDADALPQPDRGIRNPDNLVWGHDGYIYVQEDRSTHPRRLFGSHTNVEASIWRVHPTTGDYVRIGEIDRNARYPADTTDTEQNIIGSWESSGILDVTPLFDAAPGETLLLGTVQAHSLEDGGIKSMNLVEGAQLFMMRKTVNN
jgi:secreted PhoX family phosphatase